MNYLAHAYLSFGEPEILVGNMISDFVKGRQKFTFSGPIQKGIALHRAIDEYTDRNKATKEAMSFFSPVYRLYSGAFIDIIYDHFLANDISIFSNRAALLTFTEETYLHLSAYENILPVNFRLIFPFMKTHNWLYNYQFEEGVNHGFGGLVRRAKYLYESEIAFGIFQKHYFELKQLYQAFFPGLTDFARKNLQLF